MAKKKKTAAEFDGIFVDKAEYGEKLEGFGRLKDNILFLIENGKTRSCRWKVRWRASARLR